MLNPLNFLSKFIKSSNQKELDRIAKIVEQVNSYESKIKEISDEDFPNKTIELKEKLNKGKDINDLGYEIIKVSSNGGTTEKAIDIFKQKKLDIIIKQAVKAAHKRSKELSK